MQQRSVGLVILTDVPAMGGLCAVLQVRGEFNHEKLGPESYPGACQITVHGKCEEGEWLPTALMREIREELGPGIHNSIRQMSELNRVETEEKLVINYGCRLSAEIIKFIQLSASTGGIRLLRREDVEKIVDLKKFDKKEGVRDRSVTAMFADEKEAVRLAFKELS